MNEVEDKKEAVLRFRVTRSEQERIKRFSAVDRRKLSEFVRAAVLEKCDLLEARQNNLGIGRQTGDLMSAMMAAMQEGNGDG